MMIWVEDMKIIKDLHKICSEKKVKSLLKKTKLHSNQ